MGKRQSPHERRDPNGQQTHQGTSGSAGGPVVRGPVVRGRPSTQHHHTASIEQRQSRGQRPTDCSHPDGGGTNGHHCRFGQCLLRPTPCAPCHAAHPKEPYATCTKDKHATRAKIPGRRLQNPGTTQTPPAAEKELRHVRSHCVTHRAGRTSFTQRERASRSADLAAMTLHERTQKPNARVAVLPSMRSRAATVIDGEGRASLSSGR